MGKQKSKKIRLRYSTNKPIPGFTPELQELVQTLGIKRDGHTILLTRRNAKAIEKVIKKDDQYFLFSKILFEHFGKEKILKNEDRALFAYLRAIDIENSTGIWRYNKECKKNFNPMVEWMSDPDGDFFTRLEKDDPNLPDEIVQKWGAGFRSFSSKACKYLSQMLYDADFYYINDSYVRHALLFYLDYYGVRHEGFETSHQLDDYKHTKYKNLHDLLEKLREAAGKKHGSELTPHQIDQIIWYCYKSFAL